MPLTPKFPSHPISTPSKNPKPPPKKAHTNQIPSTLLNRPPPRNQILPTQMLRILLLLYIITPEIPIQVQLRRNIILKDIPLCLRDHLAGLGVDDFEERGRGIAVLDRQHAFAAGCATRRRLVRGEGGFDVRVLVAEGVAEDG